MGRSLCLDMKRFLCHLHLVCLFCHLWPSRFLWQVLPIVFYALRTLPFLTFFYDYCFILPAKLYVCGRVSGAFFLRHCLNGWTKMRRRKEWPRTQLTNLPFVPPAGVHYFLSESLTGEPLSGKLECLRRGLVMQLEALALSYPTLRIRARSSASLPYLAMDGTWSLPDTRYPMPNIFFFLLICPFVVLILRLGDLR